MKRYLIYFSYIGSRFRGLQKQLSKGILLHPDLTVQSVLELGLAQLRPINQPFIYPASRTDSGVHCLCNAAHVDLVFLNDKSIYNIVRTLNTFFYKNEFDIRVLNVRVVPRDFSARFSVYRKKYLYRFAVLRPGVAPDVPNKLHLFPIPILEKDRTHFVMYDDFDPKLAQEAATLFVGVKDFRAFMGRPSSRPEVKTMRAIESLELRSASPLLPSSETEYFSFWEVVCTGHSFLFRQMRRTVGVLIAVGLGRMSLKDVEDLFESPTNNTWNTKAAVVPGYGLYLISVEYREEDLLTEADSTVNSVASL